MAELPKAAIRLLQTDKGKDLAVSILARHFVPGLYLYANDLRKTSKLKPLHGSRVKIVEQNNALSYGDAHIHTPGIAARDGVIFPVDRVLPLRKRKTGNA